MHRYLPSWLRWGVSSNDTASTTSSWESVSPLSGEEAPEAQQIVSDIVRLHAQLSSLPDLGPCDITNALFGELVAQCTQAVGETIASKVCELSPKFQRLRLTTAGHEQP
jgi:hypothetical protein